MNKFVWAIAILVLVVPVRSWSRQSDSAAGQNQAQSSSASSASSAPAAHQDSLAEAARKTREQKKNAGTQAKVFTNDNLPTSGGISTVGEGSSAATGDNAAAPPAESTGKPGTDEQKWRQHFADLHHRLEQDQATLEVDQRELGELNTQFYGDPMKGMQQELTRSDINDKVAEIDKMKAQVAADQKAIDDAEDELRKSGGDPGWAR